MIRSGSEDGERRLTWKRLLKNSLPNTNVSLRFHAIALNSCILDRWCGGIGYPVNPFIPDLSRFPLCYNLSILIQIALNPR